MENRLILKSSEPEILPVCQEIYSYEYPFSKIRGWMNYTPHGVKHSTTRVDGTKVSYYYVNKMGLHDLIEGVATITENMRAKEATDKELQSKVVKLLFSRHISSKGIYRGTEYFSEVRVCDSIKSELAKEGAHFTVDTLTKHIIIPWRKNTHKFTRARFKDFNQVNIVGDNIVITDTDPKD